MALAILILAFAATMAGVNWWFAAQDAAMYKKLYHDEHQAFLELSFRAWRILDEWETADARRATPSRGNQ